QTLDTDAVKPKWNEEKVEFFKACTTGMPAADNWEALAIETAFKDLASEKNIKMGELQMIFRVMLVGSKIGPGVFVIAAAIGREQTVERIENALKIF
ncbi:MAG: glutamate--tRNA ligase, partial [Gloeobacteraceae cyanobacterium ES-bin-316]|nr:glutamate--tRNA ligase [Ferruginibacter sp.]